MLKSECKKEMLAKNDFRDIHKELVIELFNMESIWVAYTDCYRYLGIYKYHKIDSREELIKAVSDSNAKGVVITDGPNYSVSVAPQFLNDDDKTM